MKVDVLNPRLRFLERQEFSLPIILLERDQKINVPPIIELLCKYVIKLLISLNVILVPVTPYENDKHDLRGSYGLTLPKLKKLLFLSTSLMIRYTNLSNV